MTSNTKNIERHDNDRQNWLENQAAAGEDSRRQFKADVKNIDSLTAEMAAFANCEGGTIFIGVADDGSIKGISRRDVARINQIISNAASQHIRAPLLCRRKTLPLLREELYWFCQFQRALTNLILTRMGLSG